MMRLIFGIFSLMLFISSLIITIHFISLEGKLMEEQEKDILDIWKEGK